MVHSSPGDPEGRRLARRRSRFLAEAARVARALEILLERAEFPKDACTKLVSELGAQERAEVQKAHGRIEARRRFKKHSAQPLLDQRPISHLHIDEAGKSNPENLPGRTFFALGGVALQEPKGSVYCRAADEIKLEFFGRADFAFHEPFMRTRYQTRDVDYSFGGDKKRQAEFDSSIEQLLKDTEFTTFGVAVRKTAFEEDFVKTGLDPYLPTDIYALAMVLLLERYVDGLAHHPVNQMGRVTLESQGPKEDAYHQLV